MSMSRKTFLAAVASLCVITSAIQARAALFTIGGHTYTTEFNAGTGNDHAMMLLEYSPAQTFLFGYAWPDASPTPTGLQMLNDLAGASGNTLQVTDPGGFVESVVYAPSSVSLGQFSWCGYFTSPDGTSWPPDSFSQIGAGDRALADGAWDAWVYQPDYTDESLQTIFPTVTADPAPEPASLVLLGAGAMLFVRRRARR